MRLSRLTVTNYTRLPDIDLELRDQVVLVGRNDVGKTSILRCLHYVLGASLASLYQFITPADVRDSTMPLTIMVELRNFTDDERAYFPDEISVDADGTERLQIAVTAGIVQGDETAVDIRRYFPEGRPNRAPSRDQLNAIGWQYLPAVRSGGAEGVEGRASALRALLGTVDLGAEKKLIDSSVESLNDVLHKSTPLIELRRMLASHLRAATSSNVRDDDLYLRTAASSDDLLRQLGLYINAGNRIRPISEQSDGMNALAAIAFYDLSSSGSNIVAIDEPETHLHPASQRAIASLLSRGPNQKVISTHSPFVVQKFDPEHIIAFAADRRCRQLRPGALSKTDKLMAQWWTNSRLEPLTSRFVLLVEGPADRIIVQACASAMGVNLDSLGISIVELGGAQSFKQAYRLFGPDGFGIDLLGLVDQDCEGKWASEIGVSITDLQSNGIFVARADLEEEYTSALGAVGVVEALTTFGAFTTSQLLEAYPATRVQDLSDKDLANFCRKSRNKVHAALAVSSSVRPEHVAKMNGIKSLIERLETL